jgi:GntR family transcriptional regulator/MocR family aminotransferase
VDTQKLAWAAAQQSVLIESGAQFFFGQHVPVNFMRLGFHAIDAERIRPGIRVLAEVLGRM